MADETKEKAAAKKLVAAKKLGATAPAKSAAAKPAVKAAAPAKAEATPKEPAKQASPVKAEKPVKSAATVTVTRTGSDLGRPEWARQTLIGLGLAKTHRTRTLEDTPAVRGMINRVKHLVRVEEDKSKTGT